ncbi:MAG: hypothetical protein Q7S13_02495 [Candidatus Omnitrophota bacterium]|jgi:hypothetical protein|nr:hypothetical protein [Candidatus Omnitrophota bacterium]
MNEEHKVDEKKKKAGKTWAALGVVLLVLGLGADWMGLGSTEGFGYKQLIVTLVGAAFLLIGVKACGCCGASSCCKK